MKKLLIFAVLAAGLAACSHSKTDNAIVEEQPDALSLVNKWQLIDFVGDSGVVEVDSDEYFIQFLPDNTFGMTTDCNSLGGEYKVVGDSLILTNLASTEMLCPNEAVEQAMKASLPMVDNYGITPDSMLVLRADGRILARYKYAAE